MFSPYYAWSGRRDPLDHCAFNIALYGPGGRWAMTERRRAAVARTSNQLRIGPSALNWDGREAHYELAETAAPLPRPLRGEVRLTPASWNARAFTLSEAGRHIWRPVAPLARVAVRFTQPELNWEGDAYLDFNAGDGPLETAFRSWTWSRARTRAGAAIFYEAERRETGPLALALGVRADGVVREADAPPRAPLKSTLWGLARSARSQGDARVVSAYEDAPFYARARIAHRLDGEEVISMHETLDLNRFAHPLVRLMLPFRMPRW